LTTHAGSGMVRTVNGRRAPSARPQTLNRCARCIRLPGRAPLRACKDLRGMVFDPRNLGVLTYAGGFSLWQYRSTTDSAESIASPGHMAPVAAMLRPDDLILVSAADRGLILRVVSVAGGSVATEELAAGPPSGPPTAAILDGNGDPILTEAGAELLVE